MLFAIKLPCLAQGDEQRKQADCRVHKNVVSEEMMEHRNRCYVSRLRWIQLECYR